MRRCLGCMELFDDQFTLCPHCGYIVGTAAEEAVHIEPGTLLHNRYIVGKVLGFGGFGVTYIGWDGRLEQKVAIKEYLPGEFSTRMPGQSRVTVFGEEKGSQFRDGMEKFVEEAKRLAKFQNENGIVKVFDSFQENDTAYIVMEFLDGETLTSYLKRYRTIPPEEAVAMLMPVMQSLKVVHDEGLLHRDIAPDNIFITKTGEIKLIDFGASRYATTSHSKSLTVIIKPGYSPEEQYRSRGDQGPYTDVYALASTLYKMITGKTAPDAMERRAKYEGQNKDILEEPHKLVKNIPQNIENAILNAMNVRIEDRTPDIAAFITELYADPPAKRRYGKIKRIDIYRWPLWLKVTLPLVLALAIGFGALVFSGVIQFDRFSQEIVIPDNIKTVPDLEGMSREEAIALIEKNQLLAEAAGSIESEYLAAGTIVLQTPAAGSYLGINGTVELIISSGASVEGSVDGISTVPFLIWSDKDEAIAKLMAADLGEPIIEEVYDDNVAAGMVISQSIEAETEVEVGTVITLTISLGPASFELPDVLGMDAEEAEKLLLDKGLIVHFEYVKNDEVPENQVVSMDMEAGSDVKPGDEVTLEISSGKNTVEVADVSGQTAAEAVKKLEEQGFKVVTLENYDVNVEAGKVISQSPAGGSGQLPGATITIYVSKGKQAFTVTYNANGGTVNKTSQTVYYMTAYGTLPTPTRSGYTFVGWFTDPSGGTRITADSIVTTTVNQTLYAQWATQGYTVTLNANGGSVQTGSIIVSENGTYGTLPTPTRSGYTFEGWYTASSGGRRVTSSTKVVLSENHTLYAHWSVKTYTITLNANGGSVAPARIELQYGDAFGSLPMAARNGYTFLGWFTAKTGGRQVTEDMTFTQTSDQTLYARWQEITVTTYTVTFAPEGGTVSPTSAQVAYGEAYGYLPTPLRAGYTFLGWYTAQTGGTRVYSTSVHNVKGTLTLYAHWQSASYTVTLDPSGGTCSTTSIRVSYGQAYGTLPTPTNPGYTFLGWYTYPSGGTRITSSTIFKGDRNQTLYAQWQSSGVTVTLNANGGTVSPSTITVSAGQTYGTLPTPTRSGYTFLGWFTDPANGKPVYSSTVVDTSVLTLYAAWSQSAYTVTLDPNGGTVAPTKLTVAAGQAYGTLPTPTRSGYTFVGWFTAASGGTQVTSTTIYNVSGNQTLYAHWSQSAYTVTLDPNGGSVAPTKFAVVSGQAYGSLPTPTRSGYNFVGWFTAKTGGTQVYSSTIYSLSGNQTLYAHWEQAAPTTYTVTLNANGGSVAPTAITVTAGGTYSNLPTPTRSGYTFKGWFTASSGGTQITNSTVVNLTGNQTLYAQWTQQQLSYTVYYKSVNGTNLGSTTSQAQSGSTVTLTPQTFSGYNTPASQTVTITTSGQTVTFSYTPTPTATTQNLASGWWWQSNTKYGITYDAKAEYRNRTANSVEIRIVWKQSIKGAMFGYNQYFYCSLWHNGVNKANTGNVKIASTTTWPYNTNGTYYTDSKTVYSSWIKVPLTTTNATTVVVNCDWWTQSNGNQGSWGSKVVNIPAY